MRLLHFCGYGNQSKHLPPARLCDAKGSHEEVSFFPLLWLTIHTLLLCLIKELMREEWSVLKEQTETELGTIDESRIAILWK